jgi:HEPN domain-containing protein
MKPHKEWQLRAEHDIESARYLLTSPSPLFDVAIYHTQQCAEKTLKAFLAYHRQVINKTHNLKMLAETCAEIDETFHTIIDDCIFLNPFAILYRYPDSDDMPDKDEVVTAIAIAEKIVAFVNEKIND